MISFGMELVIQVQILDKDMYVTIRTSVPMKRKDPSILCTGYEKITE